MRYRPTLDEFTALAATHTAVPVYRRVTADDLTPVSAFAKLRDAAGGFLFESVVGTERHGRYSFLGSAPFEWFEAYGTRVRARVAGGNWVEAADADPLKLFEKRVAAFTAPHLPGLPRFSGGAVGYAGYDTVRYMEHLPDAPPDDRGVPDLAFAFYDQMAIFDHIFKTLYVVVTARITPGLSPREAYQAACDRVDRLVDRLATVGVSLPPADVAPEAAALKPGVVSPRYASNFPPGGYQAAVRRAKEYILAGDAFQVVLSQRFRTRTTAKPFDIYRALRIVNPSPFMFFVEGGPATLVGASPEIMCRVEGGEVTVRPLAGTRPRGKSEGEDRRLAEELLADPKERAEHVMLVDLARNDVGRVSAVGSVRVRELMTVERYSHVMHISSTVTGDLAAGRTPFDALRSALPAGTLSGAPKVRAMEIIDELEPHRRGPYGGAVGYVDYNGDTDTCIALRTMVVVGDTADIQAGAGLVADSDPDAEHAETVNKAMGLMRAVEVAETQL